MTLTRLPFCYFVQLNQVLDYQKRKNNCFLFAIIEKVVYLHRIKRSFFNSKWRYAKQFSCVVTVLSEVCGTYGKK